MKKTQKYLADDLELFSVIIMCDDDNQMGLPFFCPVCEFVMKTQEDFSSHQRFNCCYECEIAFAQPMRNKWDSGWRPSDKVLNNYKKRIREQSLNLFRDEDN